jgi:flagellar biosynthesis/type III secretory pathway M-ring protein FliF/YscJ
MLPESVRMDALPAGVTSERGAERAAHLKEETSEMIRQKPVHTARAVQAWLREEPS